MKLLLANQKTLIKLSLGLLLLATVALEFDMRTTQAHNAYLTSKSFNEVRVLAGDSVWSIASKFVTNKEDVRELITAIRQVNGLSASVDIYPGQVLKIPLRSPNHQIEPAIAKTR